MADFTTLYRCYNAEAELLYVGISVRCLERLSIHRLQSFWFRDVAVVDVQHFDTRELAIEAECKAIAEERPRHNVTHTGKARCAPTPPRENVRQLVACPLCKSPPGTACYYHDQNTRGRCLENLPNHAERVAAYRKAKKGAEV